MKPFVRDALAGKFHALTQAQASLGSVMQPDSDSAPVYQLEQLARVHAICMEVAEFARMAADTIIEEK